MSCNKTKRQKSMIYDKKSDILPRLCFGLIYPPQKKRKPRDAEAFAFLSVLDAYDEVFACHAKVFARLYKSLGQAFSKACEVEDEESSSRSAEREILFRRFSFC